jgi:hypothetical protein
MPFGGVNASGFGRFGMSDIAVVCPASLLISVRLGGPEGLRSLCSIKAVSEDRFFKLIQTGIPGPLGAWPEHGATYRSIDMLHYRRLSSSSARDELELLEWLAKLCLRTGNQDAYYWIVQPSCRRSSQMRQLSQSDRLGAPLADSSTARAEPIGLVITPLPSVCFQEVL